MGCRLELAILLLAAFVAPAFADEPVKNSPSPQEVQRWIRDLDSDRFVAREQATAKLIAAGAPVVSSLLSAASDSNLEVNSRLVYVLRELTLSEDPAAQETAGDALEQLTTAKLTAVARMATATLEQIGDLRQKRALEDLVQLGAVQNPTDTPFFAQQFEGRTLRFGDKWRGELKDLRRLKWMNETVTVQLIGPRITDEWLPYLREMPDLRSLVIKRASITEAGLAAVSRMNGLQDLQVMYIPIGDGVVEQLGNLKQLASLKLYGTKITRPAALRLQESLAGTRVDHRFGAFLGVGGDAGERGFQVNLVHMGSAADKGGIRPGDEIIKIDDRPIPDFEALTKRVSEKNSGESARLEILRGGEIVKLEVTFGEWE